MIARLMAATVLAIAGGIAVWPAQAQDANLAAAELRDSKGGMVGAVTMEDTPNGVLLHATFQRMPPGIHAFHIHAVGTCEPPFTSAGGHFNPRHTKHGFRSVGGAHAGDLPNIHVPENGNLEVESLARWVRFDDNLFDNDGSAIVIHEGADDYATDPAGAAGPRIACGVIER